MNTRSLNDKWKFVKGTADIRAAAEADGEIVDLPHTWNAVDGQDGGNDYFRGSCCYIRQIGELPGEENFLQFDAAAMTAKVYLDGELIGSHEGGFSAFVIPIAHPGLLSVVVDNSEKASVYPQKADFTFYGGLYRGVKLLYGPASHFVPFSFTADYELAGDLKSAKVSLAAKAENADGQMVTFTVCDEETKYTASAAVQGGEAKADISVPNVHLWDGLKDPHLYTASAAMAGDSTEMKIGFRKMEADADKGFMLNGRVYPLRGVSCHQDIEGKGNALTDADFAGNMDKILEIGATAVRLAHYQHSQTFYDLCDENGIVVWAEIPFITMFRKEGRGDTLLQMRELITQCRHHASIFCWALSNEITAASVVNDDLIENHQALKELAHKLDPSRPTSMASVFMLETDSPLLSVPDLNAYNLYYGWYVGELQDNDAFFDEFHAKYPDMPIGLTEYGADANCAYHSAHPEKGDYTEEYQCIYHEHMLKMIEERPWLWCTFVWNLFDFGADGRDEGGKHGLNQKGLVQINHETRKDAFYLYKAYWNRTEPFVHLCGSRYANRTEDVTEIKVYSNQPSVTIHMDGNPVKTLEDGPVFTMQLPISGDHVIECISGKCRDAIRISHVSEADPSYTMPSRKEAVNNWFDEEIDPSCYSVEDKLGEIEKSPKAGPVVMAMMEKAAASRGDVATSVKDNPALQKMLARQTLISMLKQAGTDPEQIKELNRILQGIKKEN